MEDRIKRNARFYAAARKGELDFEEVRDSQDAEWAANGYRDRISYMGVSEEQKRFAYEFIQNLDCDFG